MMRTKVNPIMMNPKTIKQFTGVMDTITKQFVDRIRDIRDANNEMPLDFFNEINKWNLETVAYIALNHRMNLVGPTDPNSTGQRLIAVRILIF